MQKLLIVGTMLAISVTACKKTGDGEYEIKKPVIDTVTDTVHAPTVDARMDSIKVTVPKVEMKTESKTIKVPKVEIKKP